MIEDALKSTRTLHRLIMTVALVTIVFALSVGLPEEKAAQKELIDGLIKTDFAAYGAFGEAKVEEARQLTLAPIANELATELEGRGHLVFGLDHLADAFGDPIHVGRVLVEELNLTDVENATLSNLNALNSLDLAQDIQIVVPRIDALWDEIDGFLTENPGAGRRVDTIRLSIDDFEFTAVSFLPGENVTAGLYFELLDAVRTRAAPTFSANFLADIVEIPDSSFLSWVNAQAFDEKLVEVRGNEIEFAPELQSAPNGFRSETLGVLAQRLEQDISRSSPANQTVSILGTNVPGALAIFASPIVLIALCYYFSAHTGHLSRIVSKDRDSFEEFSWLPISLKGTITWQITKKIALVIPVGLVECASSAMLLPITAIGLLYVRLQAFGELSGLQLACLAIAAAGICLFGFVAVKNTLAIREFMTIDSDDALDPAVGSKRRKTKIGTKS